MTYDMKTHLMKLTAFVAVMLSCATAMAGVGQHPSLAKGLVKGVADSLSITNTSIAFGDKVLLHNMDISIAALDSTAVPELDFGMFNVSVEGEGYRFLPHGTHFDGEGATVRLKYDRTRIPSGYTEDDIRTYYFDPDRKCWVALPRVEVDKQSACVVSKTTHFTDMINGVIVAPESPETDAFTPTMMNDIKAADPTSKINIIMPPTANNRGSANLTYPFEMPPARNGMQPQLALSYNSDGGSGWAGEGWDISIPTITVDTRWGVPRYNISHESETYLLNGQMLAMMRDTCMTVAHRDSTLSRVADRQFFLRQGGDFSKIVRKGNSPDSYYWEITDRNGVVYTYGGNDNAVLKDTITDVHGNRRLVAAEWKLTRVQETHGDYIVYEYENKATTSETVLGGLTTHPVYLSKIHVYQMKVDSTYLETSTIVFHPYKNNGNYVLKSKQHNNARYGFLTSSNRLLRYVEVKFLNERLRLYRLDYKTDTTFHVDQLIAITHLDNNMQEVASQEFDYYDDIIHSDDDYYVFDDETTLNYKHNIEKTAFSKVIPVGHSSHATAIGGTKTKSLGGSVYTGVGAGFSSGKSLTGGLSVGYSQSTSEGEVTLIDINGDGLPDRVYKDDGVLKFCPQKLDDTFNFGDPVTIHADQGVSLSNFSRSKASSVSGGGKCYPGIGPAFVELGLDLMTSTTKTTHYFADVNSDGLVDIVANGEVYFNHLNSNEEPTFTLSSGATPSPINNTGEIFTTNLVDLMDSQDSLILSSPMQDVVRFWKAPLSGTISITSALQRLHPTGEYDQEEYDKADSLTVTIQQGTTELWVKTIQKGDLDSYNDSISNLHVTKGDTIFFRLQSGRAVDCNGFYDIVKWAPVIQYDTLANFNNLPNTEYEPNGHSSLVYHPYEDDVNLSSIEIPIDTAYITVTGSLIKPVTSDDVQLKVRYHANSGNVPQVGSNMWSIEAGDTTSIYTIHLDREIEISSDNYQIGIPDAYNDGSLSFEVSAKSNVAWEDVIWRPIVRSVYVRDTVMDTVEVPVAAKYIIFNKLVKFADAYLTDHDSLTNVSPGLPCSYVYRPWFWSNSNVNDSVTITFKSNNVLYEKRTLPIVDGHTENIDYDIILPAHQQIWVEYYTENQVLADSVTNASIKIRLNIPSRNNDEDLNNVPGSHEVSVYTIDSVGAVGPTHRGWGQFIYNAYGDRWNRPIEKDSLFMPSDSASCNPRTMSISLLSASAEDPTYYIGPKEDIFIHGDTISSARLADNQVIPDALFANFGNTNMSMSGLTLQGTAARGLTLVSKTNSKDSIAGGGFSVASLSGNFAGGTTTTKNAFMDMNGDGYPDIVTEKSIQYTNPVGGFSNGGMLDLESPSFSNEETSMKSINNAEGIAFGGNPIHAFSTLKKGGTAEVSNANSKVAANIGLSKTWNSDYLRFSYIDINGDGLPDMLSLGDNGELSARLNLGYNFSEAFPLQVGNEIQRSKATTKSANLGFNIDAASFAGGFGVSTTTSLDKSAFIDVNGDGLPDKIFQTDNGVFVYFNHGNGFDTDSLRWVGLQDISKTSSTTLSANASFSINIPVFLGKITITPGVNTGWGMSRPNYELRDLDGDGFLDVLNSNSEDSLTVKYSTIARTNKLKRVTNTLGGSFTIDYEHSTPTYGLPCGKWVMSGVEVNYGLDSTDYAIPNSKTSFEYNGGRRDRHEREFLGFAEVISSQLDTEHEDALYRKTVELYDTASIYTAGNLIGTYVQDSSDAKFTEVHNDYYFYGLTNEPSNFNGGKYKYNDSTFYAWNDRGVAYAPLKYTVNKQEGQVMSEEWNDYYVGEGDHGLLHSYKYSDKGLLGENGDGDYDYKTGINYTSNLSGNNHIFGLPFKVTVSNEEEDFHEVIASYNTKYPNHILSIRRHLDNNRDMGYNSGGGTGEVVAINENDGIPYTVDYPDTEEDPHILPLDPSATYATTSYHYDNFGNIDTVALPRGNDNTRVWYKYQYDDTLNTYLTQIDDVFDLSSRTDWFDYRYGISNHREDQNGVHYHTTTDNLGRLTSVTSPNELPNGSNHRDPSITFEYYPKMVYENGRCIPAHAITTYYFRRKYKYNSSDKKDVKSMRIVTFVDGFGRVIETRKESYIRNQ